MAKVKIGRGEIEKMLKEQLGIEEVKWDDKGNANVELDLDKLKEKEKVVERVVEHHYNHSWRYYPVYLTPPTRPKPYPYWSYTTSNAGKVQSGTLTFQSAKTPLTFGGGVEGL